MSHYPSHQPIQYATPQARPSTGLAIAALICGCVGFIVPLLGLVAVVLGIVALVKRKSAAEPGKGLAIGGIVTGALSLLLLPMLLFAILVPSLGRAREAANRIKCASNMRQIGLALKLYANEDRTNNYPPDLATLLQTQDITSDVFVCPSSNDTPANPNTPQTWAKDLKYGSGMCSYIYVPGLNDNSPANAVVLYEPITNHDGDGSNFLMVDGHVEWLSPNSAQAMIKQIESGINPPK